MFAWVRKQKNKKGFTLLELIVVMAVLAILVAMGVPRFLGYTKEARVTAMKADAGIIERACMQYALMSETGEDWPKGTEIDLDTTEDLNGDLADLLADCTVYEIDEEAVSKFIRSTSNEIKDFVLVVDGEYEGEVFHKEGISDKEGKVHFGVSLSIPAE